jgi:hypothetical protein
MSHTDQPTDPISLIEENEEIFETISEEADDPRVAERFGSQPLALLEFDRERRDQE